MPRILGINLEIKTRQLEEAIYLYKYVFVYFVKKVNIPLSYVYRVF